MRRAITILLMVPLVVCQASCFEKKSKTQGVNVATTPQEEILADTQAEPKATAPAKPGVNPVPQDNPIPLEKWSGKVLETEWGLKIKAVTYHNKTWKVLVVFTKDLEGDSLASLRQCFQGVDPRKGSPPIYVHFFDEDMVLLASSAPGMIEGFLSGVKDDAVRIVIDYLSTGTGFEKARKAEFRGTVPKTTTTK